MPAACLCFTSRVQVQGECLLLLLLLEVHQYIIVLYISVIINRQIKSLYISICHTYCIAPIDDELMIQLMVIYEAASSRPGAVPYIRGCATYPWLYCISVAAR